VRKPPSTSRTFSAWQSLTLQHHSPDTG
jgi:hypothetical protein